MGIERLNFRCEERWIAGICSGIAWEQGWPEWAVRLFFVVCTLLSGGFFALVYVLLWFVLPERTL